MQIRSLSEERDILLQPNTNCFVSIKRGKGKIQLDIVLLSAGIFIIIIVIK